MYPHILLTIYIQELEERIKTINTDISTLVCAMSL
jgi:hypothetical protein